MCTRPNPDHSDLAAKVSTTSGLLPHDGNLEWTAAGWSEDKAVPWWLRGFTPAQAIHLTRRLEESAARAAASGIVADSADVWLASGLSREDITLCISNGLPTVDEGEAFAARAAADPFERSTLRLLTALAELEPGTETQS